MDAHFFYVASCYGGGLGIEAMTIVAGPETVTVETRVGTTFDKVKGLSSKQFIEVLEGVPGHSVIGAKSGINTFLILE